MTTTIDTYNNIFPDVSDTIVPKNSLFAEIKKSRLCETLVKEIQKIPDYTKYRTDLELIKFTVNLIENMITEKKAGVLKKDVVISSFHKLFNLTTVEQKVLSDSIEFLSNNKKIKKLSKYRKYLVPLGKYIIKKIL